LESSESLLGMTTTTERAYFEEYARSTYSGAGEIVDLGCWLGSTTISLAKGLTRNPSSRAAAHRIHAYDQFLWYAWMDECVRGTGIEGKYKPGDSFLDEFHKRTAPWADRILVHAGDLCELGWSGGPIEFLLVDVMKSWQLANATIRGFFPSLIPNVSHVLQQDFAHPYTSWIHLIHYRLRDYFRLVHIVPYSQSFVFKYVKQLPAALIDAPYSASTFSNEEVDLAFEQSISSATDRQTQGTIAASKVMHYIHTGEMARARTEFARLMSHGYPLVQDIKAVQALLKE
jgi:hypothetical protein